MHTKTMEGLIGARTNMDLLNTPFRVYKEARRRGDEAAMERAMGYVTEYANKADEYKTKADEGMKEDAEEARKKAELEREKAIRKRREEREKLEEKIEENKDKNDETVIVEVSEEGKAMLKENAAVDGNEKEPVIYTKDGEISRSEQSTSISIFA